MASRLLPLRLLPVTMIVILLLLLAKVVTFAKNADDALAAAPPPVSTAPSPGPIGPTTAPTVSIPPTSAAEVSTAERALLQDLRNRREKLDAREHALEERNAVLEAAEARLQSKIDRLTAIETRLDKLDHARKQRQDENWSGLVKVYETMKPRDAAGIFDVLDMHVLLEVLDRMNERKAAGILAAMQPERARLATQMLAQMRLRQDVVALPTPAIADANP